MKTTYLALLDQFRYMGGLLSMVFVICDTTLHRREHYGRRVLLSGIICVLLAFAFLPVRDFLKPIQASVPYANAPYWLFVSFSPVAFILTCYDVSSTEAFFCAMTAGLTEAAATIIIRNLFVYTLFPEFPESHPVVYTVLLILYYVALCWIIRERVAKKMQFGILDELEEEEKFTVHPLVFYILQTTILSVTRYVMEVVILPMQAYGELSEVYRQLQLFLILNQMLICTVLQLLIWLGYGRLAEKTEKNMIARIARERAKQYEFSRENIEMINRKVHDFKHQLQVLAAVTEEERQHQMEETNRAIGFYDAVVKTENEALNVLLTEKSFYCTNHQIRLSCMVNTRQLEKIRLVDLYTLLGNALDNAIESAEQVSDPEKKVISLSILDREGMLYIRLENYYEQMPDIQDGIPQTRKTDKQNHGFGLKSIKYIAQSYGGRADIRMENQIFYLEILIP